MAPLWPLTFSSGELPSYNAIIKTDYFSYFKITYTLGYLVILFCRYGSFFEVASNSLQNHCFNQKKPRNKSEVWFPIQLFFFKTHQSVLNWLSTGPYFSFFSYFSLLFSFDPYFALLFSEIALLSLLFHFEMKRKQEGPEGPGTLTWDRRFLNFPFFHCFKYNRQHLGGLNLNAIVQKCKNNICKRIF